MSPESSQTRQGEERRREVVQAAIDVFGESGFGGARVDEVAARVGIKRPSVLYHFPDKHVLYEAALAAVVEEIADRVVATEALPIDRLEAIADVWIDFVIDRPNAARLLLRQLIDADPVSVEAPLASVRVLFDSIQSAIDARSAESGAGKSFDASEFSLILSSTSLVWVASQSAVQGALGLDTLAPESIQRHRRILHSLIQQLTSAAVDAGRPRRTTR